MNKIILSTLSLLSLSIVSFAKPNANMPKREAGLHKTASGCDPTTAVIDLDINNVRAHLMNGGDMWWDIPNETAAYEVPKNSNKNALFAGSLWIGGVDKAAGNKIKVAAQTYRQNGNDFWTGPLDANSSIDYQTCAEWDRFWKVNASDINKFRNIYVNETSQNAIKTALQIADAQGNVPDIIKEWPAKGNTQIKNAGGNPMSVTPTREMADYVDVDGVDGYDWKGGDYPKILGDQYIWWVYNDKGNTKTETTSDAIGLEIHAAAFAFSTNNCLNDATFYNYRVYNFSTTRLDSTYMATWSDADLGYAFDDYVGCDTSRGLGILYNGDTYDEGATGYGYEIPMVGVDYFQGPKYFNTATQKDTELKMSVFTYYDNGAPGDPYGNPEALAHYYQYMTGTWKNKYFFTISNTARDQAAPRTNFIFTGDPCKNGTWSEANNISGGSNVPFDRRFIHSAGPFPLIPGSQPNDITIGAIWVPNVGGGRNACFSKIQVCDDKAQKLFIDGFKLPFGPQAPKMVVQPLDKKLVFDLDNLVGSNNEGEGYGTNVANDEMREVVQIAKNMGVADSLYKFEGYLVYQLRNSEVSVSDIRNKDGSINTDYARLVFQCDKKNGVTKVLNYEQDPEISDEHYIPRLMVEGKDNGIQHSFQLTDDAFASGSVKTLVNYKTYYYVAIAYAYNKFAPFNESKVDSTQNIEYLESRTDGKKAPIQVIKAMPHPATDSLYVQTYADYGTGIQLTRVEGEGNGGIAMDLTEESEAQALTGPNYQSLHPTYKPNAGPLHMKVVNPDSIKAGTYSVRLVVNDYYTGTKDTSKGAKPESTTWYVTRTFSGNTDTVYSGMDISTYNEKYLRKYLTKDIQGNVSPSLDWGLMAAVVQQTRPGDRDSLPDNGLISSTLVYADANNQWLSGVADQDGKSLRNWIRAGIVSTTNTDASVNDCSMIDWDNKNTGSADVIGNKDQTGSFEGVLGGTIAPYNLVSNESKSVCGYGLMYGTQAGTNPNNNDRLTNRLEDIYSIDIVFTSDKSLWSRCPVIEMTDFATTQSVAEGGAFKFNLRNHKSWTGNVNADGTPQYDDNEKGMSYFPGYAVNIETGERLNICFGEESFNKEDNGSDMIWNPTSRVVEFNGDLINRWGGKHVIYVSRTKYDGGADLKSKFNNAGNTNNARQTDLIAAYKTMMWVGVPTLKPGFALKSVKDGIIPTETRAKIRVTRPYAKYIPNPNETLKNNGWPLYEFTTDGIAPAMIGDAANNYTNHKDEVLKRIHAVPNPYYAVSEYESNRLETKIKIINLPEKATIKIYTLDGSLIRTINKNDNKTNYVDWDLKNSKNIPIVSGMYLIHVELPGIGETIVKWFGAMRPIDITNF